jgi:hypothetical protein
VITIEASRASTNLLLGMFVSVAAGFAVFAAVQRPEAVVFPAAIGVLLIAVWVWRSTRPPNRLTITEHEITLHLVISQRRIVRGDGQLQIRLHTSTVGRQAQVFRALSATAQPDVLIPVAEYGEQRVRQACEQMGWTFLEIPREQMSGLERMSARVEARIRARRARRAGAE